MVCQLETIFWYIYINSLAKVEGDFGESFIITRILEIKAEYLGNVL